MFIYIDITFFIQEILSGSLLGWVGVVGRDRIARLLSFSKPPICVIIQLLATLAQTSYMFRICIGNKFVRQKSCVENLQQNFCMNSLYDFCVDSLYDKSFQPRARQKFWVKGLYDKKLREKLGQNFASRATVS